LTSLAAFARLPALTLARLTALTLLPALFSGRCHRRRSDRRGGRIRSALSLSLAALSRIARLAVIPAALSLAARLSGWTIGRT
jgi:hypothetical protein